MELDPARPQLKELIRQEDRRLAEGPREPVVALPHPTGIELATSANLEQALDLVEAHLGAWASSRNTGSYNALLLEVSRSIDSGDEGPSCVTAARGQFCPIRSPALTATSTCRMGPFLFAATIAGEAGVHHGAKLLRDEISRNMAMLGISTLDEMKREFLVPATGGAVDF
jgi:hypothetical protein